ncbi:MAG: MATE family efflux transporter [Treponema sp.]|jgi:putative MATE family efflux protein|nr:MATE family efflux transporter [Treponema sp.]
MKDTGGQLDIETESRAEKRTLIVGLTWPALAESILASLVSMVDMMMVASLGSYAINAVGLVTQPRFVMLAAFMALSVGSTAMVSRFKGARDPDSANMALNQSLIMTAGITALLCLGMFFGGESLIRFLAGKNISEETVQGALSYLRIQVYGFPTLSITFTINAVLRGAGNTRAAFYNNTAANLVNVFFNYCLIGGNLGFPAMGVAGASLATVIGQCAAMGMALMRVLGGKEFVRLEIKKLFHADLSVIGRILNIGIPALIEQLILRVGMMFFTLIVTSLGDRSYAAHMIAMNIQQLSFTTGMAFGAAATTLMGQSLGRGRPDLARLYIKMTQQMSYLVSGLVAVLLFFGGGLIGSLYSGDSELIRLAANMLKIIALANPISNARFVYTAALRGAGDSRFAAVITFVGVLLIRPLLSLVLIVPHLPFQIGLAGVWVALSSDGIACFVLSRSRFMRGKWETIKV